MILKELVELYDRMIDDPNSLLPPFGWWRKKVDYRVRIGSDGEIVGILPYVVGEGKQQKDFIEMTVPYGQRSSGMNPFFLCDNGGYFFGLDEKKGTAKFEASAGLHKEVLAACTDASAIALLRFFENGPQSEFFNQFQVKKLAGKRFVFEYAPLNTLIHEVPSVIEAWNHYYLLLMAKSSSGRCSVDGEYGPLARLYPLIATDLPEAKPASLVSCNFDSAESYGMKGTENASVSEKNAFKSSAMLEWLLKNGDHRVSLGDTAVVYWTDGAETEASSLVTQLIGFNRTVNTSQDMKTLSKLTALLCAARTGASCPACDFDARFFILGVSLSNKARLSVRFFYVRTLGKILENLNWYLVDISMDAVKPISLAKLLEQLLPPGKAAVLPSTLLNLSYRALITGSLFPQSLYVLVLERMRADHAGSRSRDKGRRADMGQRAALLKACLVRKRRLKGDLREKELMMSLDQNNRNPGYVLGRLFAEIESAQIAALGKSINATVRDKYIASASATPARVFPQLMAGCQNHLSKIGKVKPGLEVVLQKEIGQIIDLLSGREGFFPKTLSLDDQGAFYIGYYQQRQANFAGKSNEADEASQE